MQRFENVSVPVDFSASSKQAYVFAKKLFGRPDTTLHIAHFVPKLPKHLHRVLFPYAAMGEDEVEFEHEIQRAAQKRLKKHLGLGDDEDATVEIGEPRADVPKFISASAADLVVMSAFGESGPIADAVGSLTERVVKTSVAPVLVTRDFETHPEINRILFATDLTRANGAAYGAAMRMAMDVEASVEALYVIPDPLLADTNNILRHVVKFDQQKIVNRSRDRIDALFERLVDNIGDIGHAEKTDVTTLAKRRKVVVGDPADSILQRADQINADLIVVGSQKAEKGGRLRFGSVAAEVLRRAPTHVMVVPIDPTPQLSDES